MGFVPLGKKYGMTTDCSNLLLSSKHSVQQCRFTTAYHSVCSSMPVCTMFHHREITYESPREYDSVWPGRTFDHRIYTSMVFLRCEPSRGGLGSPCSERPSHRSCRGISPTVRGKTRGPYTSDGPWIFSHKTDKRSVRLNDLGELEFWECMLF